MGDPTWKKIQKRFRSAFAGWCLASSHGAGSHPRCVHWSEAMSVLKPAWGDLRGILPISVIFPLAYFWVFMINYFSAQVNQNQFLLFAKRIMTAEISTYSLSINIVFLSPSNQSLSGKAQLSHKAFIITPLRNVPWGPMTATVSIVKSCSISCAGGIFVVNLLLIKTLKDWHFDN